MNAIYILTIAILVLIIISLIVWFKIREKRILKFKYIYDIIKLHKLKDISDLNNVWIDDSVCLINAKGVFTGLDVERSFLFKDSNNKFICINNKNQFEIYHYENE